MSDDLLDIADELYGLPMADFTPARDAKAKELKGSDLAAAGQGAEEADDRRLGRQHAGPPRDRAGRPGAGGGAALRDAAESLDGKELRELTKQRRQLTCAVTTRARGVAGSLGTKVTQAVADQVESTLTAAMLDPDCAKALRSGLLVTAPDEHRPGGVGGRRRRGAARGARLRGDLGAADGRRRRSGVRTSRSCPTRTPTPRSWPPPRPRSRRPRPPRRRPGRRTTRPTAP